MKLTIQLRALKERDILECITLFQNSIHAVNAKDYSSIQLEAWALQVKPEVTMKEQQVEIHGVTLTNFVMRKLL